MVAVGVVVVVVVVVEVAVEVAVVTEQLFKFMGVPRPHVREVRATMCSCVAADALYRNAVCTIARKTAHVACKAVLRLLMWIPARQHMVGFDLGMIVAWFDDDAR